MRLWSLHPEHLDPQGLVALWREALLAQAVLAGRTRGYTNHPQLQRFREQCDPLACIAMYLHEVAAEAERRGYAFDRAKIGAGRPRRTIDVTAGQLRYEWMHLAAKLERRNPEWRKRMRKPVAHPLFRVVEGSIEAWERPQGNLTKRPRNERAESVSRR
jgi:hypothetical protein